MRLDRFGGIGDIFFSFFFLFLRSLSSEKIREVLHKKIEQLKVIYRTCLIVAVVLPMSKLQLPTNLRDRRLMFEMQIGHQFGLLMLINMNDKTNDVEFSLRSVDFFLKMNFKNHQIYYVYVQIFFRGYVRSIYIQQIFLENVGFNINS